MWVHLHESYQQKEGGRPFPTLYIKKSKGYTPKGSREKNYLLATKKRNLLLSKNTSTFNNLNEEVSYGTTLL